MTRVSARVIYIFKIREEDIANIKGLNIKAACGQLAANK